MDRQELRDRTADAIKSVAADFRRTGGDRVTQREAEARVLKARVRGERDRE